MKNYRNQSQQIPITGELNKGKNLTTPQMAPSMRELLSRHALGIQDSVQYNGNFTGDLPDLRGYEPHELSQAIYENQRKVEELQEIKNQQSIQLQKAQYEAKKKKDLELLKQLKLETQE